MDRLADKQQKGVSGPRRAPAWLLPVAVALLVHLPALFCGFVYDDVPLVAENPALSASGGLTTVIGRDYGFEFAREPRGFYRPAFMALVYFVHRVAGPSAPVFHGVSLLIFCFAVALFVRLAQLLFRDRAGWAIFAGCLYAAHPFRAETVSLVMSLPDLLVEMCALSLTILLLLEPASVRWRQGVRTMLSGVLALLAALCKESGFYLAVAIAAAAMLHGLVSVAGQAARKQSAAAETAGSAKTVRPSTSEGPTSVILGGVAALCGLAAAWGIRAAVGIAAPASSVGAGRALVEDWRVAAAAIVKVIGEAFAPGRVVFWRETRPAEGLGVALQVVFAVSAIWGAWCIVRRRSPDVLILLAWIVAGLAIVASAAAGGFPYSQRYAPAAPLLLLVAATARWLTVASGQASTPRRIAMPAALFIAAHGTFTLEGSIRCLSPLSFFTYVHERNPDAALPVGAIAQTLDKERAPAEEVEEWVKKATGLDSTNSQIPALHDMLTRRYLADGRAEDAVRAARWSLQLFPRDADKHALLAAALAGAGQLDEALECLDDAQQLRPGDARYLQLKEQILSGHP